MKRKTQIIRLPKNMSAENISTRVENGQIVIDYDLKNIFDPKDGDFLVNKTGFVFIYKNPINPCFYQKVCGCYCGQAESTLNVDKCSFWTDFEGCRYATESEKHAFLDELEKYGYTWNAEKKCLENIFDPKDGDFLVNKTGKVFIYKTSIISETASGKVCGCYCGINTSDKFDCKRHEDWTGFDGCRYATESEKQAFLERLKDEGYTWDTEKKRLEEYVWYPQRGEKYYYIDSDLIVYSAIYDNWDQDNRRIAVNNCFKVKSKAKNKAEELRIIFKKK